MYGFSYSNAVLSKCHYEPQKLPKRRKKPIDLPHYSKSLRKKTSVGLPALYLALSPGWVQQWRPPRLGQKLVWPQDRVTERADMCVKHVLLTWQGGRGHRVEGWGRGELTVYIK